MRILYVFAQFPMTVTLRARANEPTVYETRFGGREKGELWTRGKDEYATARLPFYRSEDIGFINIVG